MESPNIIRSIARLRLKEAQVLATNAQPEGAFYLAGYGVELILKAKVAERLGLPWLFDARFTPPAEQFAGLSDLRNLLKTHNLLLLLAVAGLKPAYDQQQKASKDFFKYKSLLESWSEGIRYQLPGSVLAPDAQNFLNFLTAPTGFLQWIETN